MGSTHGVDLSAVLGATHTATLATSGGVVAALVVTVVVLLILGVVFWAFLRRGREAGVAPLAVDRLGSHSADAAPGTESQAEQAIEDEHAIEDEINEGGRVDGTGPGSES